MQKKVFFSPSLCFSLACLAVSSGLACSAFLLRISSSRVGVFLVTSFAGSKALKWSGWISLRVSLLLFSVALVSLASLWWSCLAMGFHFCRSFLSALWRGLPSHSLGAVHVECGCCQC